MVFSTLTGDGSMPIIIYASRSKAPVLRILIADTIQCGFSMSKKDSDLIQILSTDIRERLMNPIYNPCSMGRLCYPSVGLAILGFLIRKKNLLVSNVVGPKHLHYVLLYLLILNNMKPYSEIAGSV